MADSHCHSSASAAKAGAVLSDALSCPICLDTLQSPMLLSCCGNTFCAACLHAALSASPFCPLCRAHASWDNASPNRALGALLPESQRLEGSLCWAAPKPSSQASTRPRERSLDVDESAPLRSTDAAHLRGDDAMVQAAWREQCARARCAFYAARESSCLNRSARLQTPPLPYASGHQIWHWAERPGTLPRFVAVTITLMIFLRVEEEEYGREYRPQAQSREDELVQHEHVPGVRRRPGDVGGLLVSLSLLVSMLACLCRREVAKYFGGREEARRRRRGRALGLAVAV